MSSALSCKTAAVLCRVIPKELAKEGLHWQQKNESLRFAELDPSSPGQLRHIESVKAQCPGVKVTRVVVIDNKNLEGRFAAQYPLLKDLCSSTVFRPVGPKDPQKQVLDAQLTRHLRDLAGIRGILVAFNGTTEVLAWKMCTSGIVNYKAKDAGTILHFFV